MADAQRSLDVSRLSVNIVLVVSIIYGTVRVTTVGNNIVHKLDAVAGAPAIAAKAHDDAEAALVDGARQRTDIDALKKSTDYLQKWFLVEWNYNHGRLSGLRWHRLDLPLPNLNEPPPPPQEME